MYLKKYNYWIAKKKIVIGIVVSEKWVSNAIVQSFLGLFSKSSSCASTKIVIYYLKFLVSLLVISFSTPDAFNALEFSISQNKLSR